MSIEKFEKLVIGRKKKKGKWYYMWIEDGKFHVKEEGDGNPLDADPILEDRFDYKVVTEFGNMLKADVIDNAIYKGYPTWSIEEKHANYFARRAADFCDGMEYDEMVNTLTEGYIKHLRKTIYYLDDKNHLKSKEIFMNEKGIIDEWNVIEDTFFHTKVKLRAIGGKVRGKVFDICDVALSYSTKTSNTEIKKFINTHKKDLYGFIYTKVNDYLKESRFDVPVEYLSIEKLTLSQHRLCVMMPLKKINI